MVWRLPAAALLAVLAGVPLAILFDWALRGVSPSDPLALSWYVGLALLAFPLAMLGMAVAGTVLYRTGMGLRFDQPVLATIAGAIGGVFAAGVVALFFFGTSSGLRAMAIGYGAAFGLTSGFGFWLLYRKPFRRLARSN
ncbi:hypothetical protein [Stakelama marina]|uniref:Uncharacterized protein n=1 Tax=Stakelama marina TaxID=2826939 RepID=A0A8T4ICD9_9SPHN|nr:hypothetical protein [Stakelama marina]MBR0552230.1 hypothetical protein [Stakelama marina]